MTLYDLNGKTIYAGSRPVEKVYLGSNLLINNEPPPYLAQDSDFHDYQGRNVYSGTPTRIEIPHTINGKPVTTYRDMFSRAPGRDATDGMTKVVGTNKNVTNAQSMFEGITTEMLDVSELDLSSVTSALYLFQGSNITSLDISKLELPNLANTIYFFNRANIPNFRIGSKTLGSRENVTSLFFGLTTTHLDATPVITSGVDRMNNMFQNVKADSIDVSNFDTRSVSRMTNMFRGVEVDYLDLTSFNTRNATHLDSMFRDAKINTLDLSSFDTRRAASDMYRIFQDSNIGVVYVGSASERTRMMSATYKPSNLNIVVK